MQYSKPYSSCTGGKVCARSRIIESNVIVDDKIVPLAGHDHVIVAIQSQFAGTAGFVGSQCGNTGNQCRLAFLATKCATHSSANHSDVVGWPAGRVCEQHLHFVRVLRRAVHQQAIVFLRYRHRDMTFEIKLVLAAQEQAAIRPVWRSLQRGVRIATDQCFTGQDERFFFDRRQRVQNGVEFLVVDARQPCGLSCGIHRCCYDCKYRLSDVLHKVGGENRIIGNNRSVIIISGDIACEANTNYAWRCKHVRKIDVADFSMRD